VPTRQLRCARRRDQALFAHINQIIIVLGQQGRLESSTLSRFSLWRPQRKRSRVLKTRQFEHNIPRLSSVLRCLGPGVKPGPRSTIIRGATTHPCSSGLAITACNPAAP
jgi:hypothetical protein